MNGFKIEIKKDEAIEISIKIAQCLMDIDQTSIFLKDHLKKEISEY